MQQQPSSRRMTEMPFQSLSNNMHPAIRCDTKAPTSACHRSTKTETMHRSTQTETMQGTETPKWDSKKPISKAYTKVPANLAAATVWLVENLWENCGVPLIQPEPVQAVEDHAFLDWLHWLRTCSWCPMIT
jgi:hypothetical protein